MGLLTGFRMVANCLSDLITSSFGSKFRLRCFLRGLLARPVSRWPSQACL